MLPAFAPVRAQQEITATIRLLPPYPVRLADYADNPQRTLITLRNNTQQTLRIQLVGTITGENGIEIRTAPQYKSPRPIELMPLSLLNLNADAISNLFDVNKLVVAGVPKEALVRGNGLPEGIYTVCIRALDYQTNEPLSAEEPIGCSNPVTISNLEPPILIKPLCAEADTIRAALPQNLIFTWSFPPGAPPGTEYIFTLVEMLDPRKNPNDAFLSATTPVFFEERVMTNAFLFGPAQPSLTPGRRYAYAVTARDPFNRVVFRNGGRSEVCSFVYGEATKTAGGLGTAITAGVIDLPATRYVIPKTRISGRVMWSFRKGQTGAQVLVQFSNEVTAKAVSGSNLQSALMDPSYGPERYSLVNQQVFGGSPAFTAKGSNAGESPQNLSVAQLLVNRITETRPVGVATSLPVFGGGTTASVQVSNIIAGALDKTTLTQLYDNREQYPLVNTLVRIVAPGFYNGGQPLGTGRTDQEGNFSIEITNPNQNNRSFFSHVSVVVADEHYLFEPVKVSIANPEKTDLYAGTVRGLAKTYQLRPTVQDADDSNLPLPDVRIDVFRPLHWYDSHPSMKPEGSSGGTNRPEETLNGVRMIRIASGGPRSSLGPLFVNTTGFTDRYYVRVQAKGYEPLVQPLAVSPQGDFENGTITVDQLYKLTALLPGVYGRVTRSDNNAPVAGVTVVVRKPAAGGTAGAAVGTIPKYLESTYNSGVLKTNTGTAANAPTGSSVALAGSLQTNLMNQLYRVSAPAASGGAFTANTAGSTRLVFGDGLTGARPPSGSGTAYHSGTGNTGNSAFGSYATKEIASISYAAYLENIKSIPKEGLTYATAVTDADGNYSISNIKPAEQPYEILVLGKNIKSTEPTTVLLNAKGLLQPQDLRVHVTLVELRGKVINDQGEAMANAQVRWKSGGDPVFTGADGRFTIRSVPGADVLSLRKTGHNDRDTALVISSAPLQETGTFVLNRLVGRLLVTVQDSITADPLAGARVQVGDNDLTGSTSGSGQVYLTGNIGGNVSLRIRGPESADYIPSPARIVAVSFAGDTTRITIGLLMGARVSGVVRAGGSPVAGARVRVDGRDDLEATTGTDGSYSLGGVPRGEYTLRATKAGLVGASQTRTFSTGTTTLDFTLTNPGVNITTLLGFPVEIDSYSESTMTISGAFVNLPDNALFKTKAGTRLPFSDIRVRRSGSGLEPLSGEVQTDVSEVRLQTFGYLTTVAQNAAGIVVRRQGTDAGKGQIAAQLRIDYAAALGNLAGWNFQTPDAQYLTTSAAPAELVFLTSAGSLPYAGDSLRIGAAGNQQLKLYGFGVDLDLSRSSVKADGLHLRGTIRMEGIPLLSSASFRLNHLWIGTDGTVKDAALGLSPAPTLNLASWSMAINAAQLNETGFRLGGKLDIRLPSSAPSSLTFSNLAVSPDQLFGGDFTLPAAGIDVFNTVAFKTAPYSRISFGQIPNSSIYTLSGNAVVTLPKYIDKTLEIKNFAVQTDGRFAAAVPANFRTDFFGLASFDISNIGFKTLGSAPSIDVTGGMTLKAIPFVRASAGGIHFGTGGRVSVDQLKLGFSLASVAEVNVGVGFIDTPARKGFEGSGSLSVGATPFGGAIRFHYYRGSGSDIDFGADFTANTPPIVLSPVTTITKVGGGFGYGYDAAAGRKKYRITVRGAMSVAPGTDMLVALDPLEVTVESGPVIRGGAAVTVLSQRVANASLVIDLPNTLFNLEAKFGVGFLQDVGVQNGGGARLVISGKPGDAYWMIGSYFRIDVLGLIRNNAYMAAGWNLNIPKHPELASYTNFIPADFRSNGTTLNGVHFKAQAHYGLTEENAACGDIAEIANGCIWLYNHADAQLNSNLVMRKMGISVGAKWGGGARLQIWRQNIAGASIGAGLGVNGSFSSVDGWNFSGNANAHLSAWFGNCTDACENKICWGGCFKAPCVPDVWNNCTHCPVPVGGKICVNPGLRVSYSSRRGASVNIDL